MDRMMHRLTLLLAFLAICMWMYACLEATQTTNPSSVDVSVETPETSTGVETGGGTVPSPTGAALELDPPSPYEVAVEEGVSIKVVTFDQNGQEVPTENISVSIGDAQVVTLVQIDGRFVLLRGVAPGQTTVIISASGLQTAAIVTVGN